MDGAALRYQVGPAGRDQGCRTGAGNLRRPSEWGDGQAQHCSSIFYGKRLGSVSFDFGQGFAAALEQAFEQAGLIRRGGNKRIGVATLA